ncbi:16163_t:CDS:2, partial [Dentiscutata erythropus]
MSVPTKQRVALISLLWMIGGIFESVGSTVQIAIAINSATILITSFGLMVVCCAESAKLMEVYSGFYTFIVIVHIIYAIYFFIAASSNYILDYFMRIAIYQLIGAFIGVYFAKLIAGYAKSLKLNQDSVQTPRKVEDPNMTNNQ